MKKKHLFSGQTAHTVTVCLWLFNEYANVCEQCFGDQFDVCLSVVRERWEYGRKMNQVQINSKNVMHDNITSVRGLLCCLLIVLVVWVSIITTGCHLLLECHVSCYLCPVAKKIKFGDMRTNAIYKITS